MIKHKDSHIDHGLTEQQLVWILNRFADREAFFIDTVELPEELGTVPCALWGPSMGDAPIAESAVVYEVRGERDYGSRMVAYSTRPTRKVTVIAGPHEDPSLGTLACILYTAFGGPLAPQEPGEIRAQMTRLMDCFVAGDAAGIDEFVSKLHALRDKLIASEDFWSAHALARTAP